MVHVFFASKRGSNLLFRCSGRRLSFERAGLLVLVPRRKLFWPRRLLCPTSPCRETATLAVIAQSSQLNSLLPRLASPRERGIFGRAWALRRARASIGLLLCPTSPN